MTTRPWPRLVRREAQPFYAGGQAFAGRFPHPKGRYVPKRARKDLDVIQDKRAEVVRLRAEGRTWDQIAAQVGYSNGSAASKAWKRAIQQRPDQTVDEVRRQEKTRLEAMDSRLSEIIACPPIKTTSIGRTQWDVRTCTCGVRGDTKREHTEDCQVQPVLDERTVIAAVTERRALGESLRRLVSADAPPLAPVLSEDYLKADSVRRQLARQVPAVTRPSLPPGYGGMSPEQQLQAVMDRERAYRDAMLAAVPAITGLADIVEAEIVDE